MFRFVANLSLILCLAAAGVTAQDASTAAAQFSVSASPLSRFFKAAAGSGGDSSGNDQLTRTDRLVSLLSRFSVFSNLLGFSTALYAKRRPERRPEPEDCPFFDVANCRVTLVEMPPGMKVTYRLGKQAITFHMTMKHIRSRTHPEYIDETTFTCIIRDSCVVDPKTAVKKYNKKTKERTITFPHSPNHSPCPFGTDPDEADPSEADPNETDPSTSTDEETAPTTSSDDEDEPTPSDNDNEQEEDNEQQQGDGGDSADFVNVQFLAQPVSVISK